MKHLAEYQPVWRPIEEYPPPKGTKILLRLISGTAIIGVYYDESGATHWTGLPRLLPDNTKNGEGANT